MNIQLLLCVIFFSKVTTSSTPVTTVGPSSSTADDSDNNFDEKSPHCFEFTWLGPDYSNYSKPKETCDTWIKNHKLKHIPCRGPLVTTYNGTYPDLDYLLKHYRKRVLCSSIGDYCIKYAYYFNDQVQNVTYMCGKVVVRDEGPVTHGCFSQYDNGYETKVCVCKAGFQKRPCNSSNGFIFDKYLLILVAALLYFNL